MFLMSLNVLIFRQNSYGKKIEKKKQKNLNPM